jgi:hypothetical protein
MFLDEEYVLEPQPFWFASSEVLADLLRAELSAISQLLAEHPGLPKLFDFPEATLSQRKVCFTLLGHRKVLQIADQNLVGRWEQPPSLDNNQTETLFRTSNLVAGDEPPWVLEMYQVVERLPFHILDALPDPLRKQGFYTNDPAKDEAIRSAANTFNSVEQIQKLTEEVLDQQFRRLAKRWPTANPVISEPPPLQTNQPAHTRVAMNKEMRPPNKRKGWQQRLKLYSTIRKSLNKQPSLTGMKFCAELDKRHARPLVDWQESGQWRNGLTWKEAWSDPILRRRIRRVRQEAMRDR